MQVSHNTYYFLRTLSDFSGVFIPIIGILNRKKNSNSIVWMMSLFFLIDIFTRAISVYLIYKFHNNLPIFNIIQCLEFAFSFFIYYKTFKGSNYINQSSLLLAFSVLLLFLINLSYNHLNLFIPLTFSQFTSNILISGFSLFLLLLLFNNLKTYKNNPVLHYYIIGLLIYYFPSIIQDYTLERYIKLPNTGFSQIITIALDFLNIGRNLLFTIFTYKTLLEANKKASI